MLILKTVENGLCCLDVEGEVEKTNQRTLSSFIYCVYHFLKRNMMHT